jgi:Tfp pilus assembly protein PilN
MSEVNPEVKGFLPEEYLVQRRERRTNVLSVGLFVLVMAGVAIAFVVTDRNWNGVRNSRNEVNKQFELATDQIKAMEAYEVRVAQMIDKAHVAVGLLDTVPKSILLAEIIARMPEGLGMLRLHYQSTEIKPVRAKTPALRSISARADQAEEGKKAREPRRWDTSLLIEGLAPTDQEVSRFMDALVELDLMRRVRLEFSREKEIDDVAMREFRITMVGNPQADVRHMASAEGDEQ